MEVVEDTIDRITEITTDKITMTMEEIMEVVMEVTTITTTPTAIHTTTAVLTTLHLLHLIVVLGEGMGMEDTRRTDGSFLRPVQQDVWEDPQPHLPIDSR